jgi:transmembrane sensor
MNEEREVGGVQDLIRRCLDGVATEIEAAELSRLVGRDARVARQLAEAAQLESRLEIVMRGGPEASQAAQPVARPRLGARRAFWAAATITAAAAALALIWIGRKPVAQEEERGAGTVVAAKPAARVDPATHIRFLDGSTADLRDKSSLLETRSATAGGIDLVLSRGGARFEVVPRHGRRFRIWVGSAYVEVIGTIFTVDRLPTGVRVSVERGVVKVVSGQNEMRLSEGTAEVVPIEATPAPRATDLPARAPERAPERLEPKPSKGTARAAVVDDEPGALLRASEAARRNGHPQDAVTSLQRLLGEHPRDPRAPYAAFILGRVLLEELHRPREAAAAFARVEALDANTPLVQDALAREVESWARAGELDRARQAAGTYLGRYPNGRRANEVRRYSRME